jgi:hypothetical protein
MEQAKRVMFRQGDVLVVLDPVAALPEGAREVAVVGARVVLAYGEVTGHAHAVAIKSTAEGKEPNVKYFDWNAERFLQVLEKSALQHEDYGTERRAVAD